MQLKKVFLVLLLLPAATFAQYAPSKAQHDKLAKQKAKLMKIQVEIARLQTEIVFEVGNLDRSCREVVLANHWPANVECNPQNLMFAAPPPPPATTTLPQASSPVTSGGPVVIQPAPAEPKKP